MGIKSERRGELNWSDNSGGNTPSPVVLTVVHVLSVHESGPEARKIRSTIRFGDVVPGQKLWFMSTKGEKLNVTVTEKKEGSRYITFIISGEGIRDLRAGSYLYDENR
jgi:hypothetical protein